MATYRVGLLMSTMLHFLPPIIKSMFLPQFVFCCWFFHALRTSRADSFWWKQRGTSSKENQATVINKPSNLNLRGVSVSQACCTQACLSRAEAPQLVQAAPPRHHSRRGEVPWVLHFIPEITVPFRGGQQKKKNKAQPTPQKEIWLHFLSFRSTWAILPWGDGPQGRMREKHPLLCVDPHRCWPPGSNSKTSSKQVFSEQRKETKANLSLPYPPTPPPW